MYEDSETMVRCAVEVAYKFEMGERLLQMLAISLLVSDGVGQTNRSFLYVLIPPPTVLVLFPFLKTKV